MDFIFETFIPTAECWLEYYQLWKESEYQSSFQAPLFLSMLCALQRDALFIIKGFREKKLMAMAIFMRHGNVLQFLSDLKNDHNYFMFHKELEPSEKADFFRALFREVSNRRWSMRLNNQPSWAGYMPTLTRELSGSSLKHWVVRHNPCLVLQTATPEEMIKATDKQKLRQKLNRLKDMGEVEFEEFRKDEDLKNWLEVFYDCHVRRWENTSTPSQYRDHSSRDFYESCLRAWIREGILVRFSLKLKGKRIAFVTALLENGYLVHHTTTFDPDFEKQSPGLILIKLIGKWVAELGMNKMEFGDGGEAYKYQFINQESPLFTIFALHPKNFPLIAKSYLIKYVREHQELLGWYRNRLRPILLRSPILRKRIT